MPSDILRHILSYGRYPEHSAVSRGFKEAEEDLLDDRVDRIMEEYDDDPFGAVEVHNWMDVRFILQHPEEFDVDEEFLQATAEEATRSHRSGIVRMCLSLSPLDYDSIAMVATANDNYEILRMMVDQYGTSNYNELIPLAKSSDIIYFLLDKGGSVDEALRTAFYRRDAKMVADIYDYMPESVHRMIDVIDALSEEPYTPSISVMMKMIPRRAIDDMTEEERMNLLLDI